MMTQAQPPDGRQTLDGHPDAEDFRSLIAREWSDIHHSRNQEWTALGIITGAHLGILQLLRFVQEMSVWLPFQVMVLIGAFLGLSFAFFGAQMTRRHVRLTRIKIGWIYRAEDSLGLVRRPGREDGIVPANDSYLTDIPWDGLMWPRPQSTSWIILCLYLLLAVFDILAVVMFAIP